MKPIRTAVGIAMIPAVFAAVWATLAALGPALGSSNATFPLLAGAATFALLHARPLFSPRGKPRDKRFYVTAHELTHALAAVFTGVKVRKISVRRHDGYVLTDSTNAFVSLAPYFVPLYTLAAAAAYWLACRFFDGAALRPWFLAAAGFTLAFHLLNTADILCGPVQRDLKTTGGAVFSVPLVLLLNCLGLAAALKLLFPELLSVKAYSTRMLETQKTVYSAVFSSAAYIFNTAKIYTGGKL